MQYPIDVKNLSKNYSNKAAVKNINFKINKNEILGLLGPNGCGKTTTIAMMLGLLKPTNGIVLIDGEDIEKKRIQLLHKMNFISPYIELPKKLTVKENLIVYGKLYGVKKVLLRLINDPKILFLDEPTASLDPETGDFVRTFIEKLSKEREMSILLASHNMDEVKRLCKNVLMMKDGLLIDRGTPNELIKKHGKINLEEVFLKLNRTSNEF